MNNDGYQSWWGGDSDPALTQPTGRKYESKLNKEERDRILERLLRDYHRDNPDTAYDYERDVLGDAA